MDGLRWISQQSHVTEDRKSKVNVQERDREKTRNCWAVSLTWVLWKLIINVDIQNLGNNN